jgi:hypothetical protein
MVALCGVEPLRFGLSRFIHSPGQPMSDTSPIPGGHLTP